MSRALLQMLALLLAAPSAERDPGPAGSGSVDRHPVLEAGTPLEASASNLSPTDLVVGVALGGEARAYPLSVLWEEDAHTVNDRVGGEAVAVAACPLAGVGTAFDRRRGSEIIELGHLVATRRGSLILYDAGSGSEWSLLSGEAFEGPRKGEHLQRVPTLFTTWARWRALHPATTVYRAPPRAQGGLDLNADRLRRIILAGDGPPAQRDWIVGLEGPATTAAVLVRDLALSRAANRDLDGIPLVVFTTDDLTTTMVWRRGVGDRVLTFEADGDRMRDGETGSSWDPLTGKALAGPLRGRSLEAMSFVTGFWHAWLAEHPDTALLDVAGDD